MLPFIRFCEGKLTVQPINYTIFLLHPRANMKKLLGQPSNGRTAKEMTAVVWSLLTQEQLKQIFMAHEEMLDA